MIDAIVAYLHYLAIMCLLAALVGEHLLLGGDLEPRRIRQLVNIDLVYIVALGVVLVTGMMRLTWLGKGPVFYTNNPLFHTKMGFFVLLALLSVYPAKQYVGLRRAIRAGSAPRLSHDLIARLKLLIRIELCLVVATPLLAVLMGRGFGY